MSKVCILGASGLIGATLVERLMKQGIHEIVPVINSAGGAWRLTRYGMPLVQANLCDADAVDRAVEGADIVVNCARVPERNILQATKNLIETCQKHSVDRLIHLSSVAVYGEAPAPESEYEDAPVVAERGSYGDFKARQDALIEKACEQGHLKASVLCIPNITGTYSAYLLFLLSGMGTRSFTLVDEGQNPVMICDVHNICHAIELAFKTDSLDGKRTFIMDGEQTTWKQLADELAPLIGHELPLPNLSSDAAHSLLKGGPRGIRGAVGTAKQIAKIPGVKKTIKQNVALTRSLIKWRSRLSNLPVGQRLVNRVMSSGSKPKTGSHKPLQVTQVPTDVRFLKHQMRGVRHSNSKAEQTLGYTPEVSFEQSMQAFALWYRTMHGHNGPSTTLLAELDAQAWQQ